MLWCYETEHWLFAPQWSEGFCCRNSRKCCGLDLSIPFCLSLSFRTCGFSVGWSALPAKRLSIVFVRERRIYLRFFTSFWWNVVTEESHWFFKEILRLFALAVNGYGIRLSASTCALQDDRLWQNGAISYRHIVLSPSSTLLTLHSSLIRPLTRICKFAKAH